jgi:anti-sigma B factor antagonist
MPTIHETKQQVPNRRSHTAPVRSHDPLAAKQTDVLQWTADTVSVDLQAAHEQHQDVAVLNVHGEIDLETAPVLREALLPILEHQTGPVIIDLSEVLFMDSTGVHVLVDTLRRLESQNRPLAIACREGGQVHRVLALAGLLDALPVYPSRESVVIGDDDAAEGRAERSPLSGADQRGAESVAAADAPPWMGRLPAAAAG